MRRLGTTWLTLRLLAKGTGIDVDQAVWGRKRHELLALTVMSSFVLAIDEKTKKSGRTKTRGREPLLARASAAGRHGPVYQGRFK
jgi:hypothetical protein